MSETATAAANTNVSTVPVSTNDPNSMAILCQMYLETLNEKELQAYHIAKSHLGMSFTLEKSNGFLNWVKTTWSTD